jgi:hypothetical protein
MSQGGKKMQQNAVDFLAIKICLFKVRFWPFCPVVAVLVFRFWF